MITQKGKATRVNLDFRMPTIGVEEEYQLISRSTGQLVPKGRAVLKLASGSTGANIQHELHLEQIEMASPVLHSSDEVRDCLVEARTALMGAALASDAALVAAGTYPLRHPEHVLTTPKPRYLEMENRYQALVRELVIFGCHVHVDMPDREMGVQVLNFSRAWLPLMQAISANSPFWHGEDTGYASYRRELWVRWPMSGIPGWFDNLADYEQCVKSLIQAGAIEDDTKIYWDARLPVRVPTIEYRVFDVQTDVEDCVALVAISRALVMRCEQAVQSGERPPRLRRELLRSAIWQAARYGLSENLIEPVTSQSIPAWQHVEQFLRFLEPALDHSGDTELVLNFVDRLRKYGTPADRQRRVAAEANGSLEAVVEDLIQRTQPRSQACQPDVQSA